LEVFFNIVGLVAEKRYPAVRKTIGRLSVIFWPSSLFTSDTRF